MKIASGLALLACSALAFGHHSRSHYPEQKQERGGATREMFGVGEPVTFLGSESELRPRDMLATHLLLGDGPTFSEPAVYERDWVALGAAIRPYACQVY